LNDELALLIRWEMVERGDVAYVGKITGRFYIVISGNNYAIPVTDRSGIMLWSKSAFTAMSSGQQFSGYDYMTFDIRDANILEDGSVDTDLITYVGNNENSTTVQYYESLEFGSGAYNVGLNAAVSGVRYTFTAVDPAGYGEGLLTGVRYKLKGLRDYDNLKVKYYTYAANEIYNDSTGTYSRPDKFNVYYSDLNNITFMLIPVEVFSYTGGSAPVMTSLMPTLTISQCATTTDNNYYNSQYCDNWENYRGFVNEDDTQPVLYYYSKNGTCGEGYEFSNLHNELIQVTSSNGTSCKNCEYDSGVFLCIEPPPPPLPPPPLTSTSPVQDDGGILNSIWFWVALVIIALVGIIVTIIIVYLAARKTGPPISEEPVES
jgi:hypothetical protein